MVKQDGGSSTAAERRKPPGVLACASAKFDLRPPCPAGLGHFAWEAAMPPPDALIRMLWHPWTLLPLGLLLLAARAAAGKPRLAARKPCAAVPRVAARKHCAARRSNVHRGWVLVSLAMLLSSAQLVWALTEVFEYSTTSGVPPRSYFEPRVVEAVIMTQFLPAVALLAALWFLLRAGSSPPVLVILPAALALLLGLLNAAFVYLAIHWGWPVVFP